MDEHYAICKNMVRAVFNYKRSRSAADRFMVDITYANYQASCQQHGIKALSKDDILGESSSDKVIFIPFR